MGTVEIVVTLVTLTSIGVNSFFLRQLVSDVRELRDSGNELGNRVTRTETQIEEHGRRLGQIEHVTN